jgi:hypothetical protein
MNSKNRYAIFHIPWKGINTIEMFNSVKWWDVSLKANSDQVENKG